jgi:hypothetical protein
VEFDTIKEDKWYLDVVNIDRYDCILGTPFMHRHGIQLDFSTDTIKIAKSSVRTFSAQQEASLLKGQRKVVGQSKD